MMKVKIFRSDLVFNNVFIIAAYRAVYSVLKVVFVLPQIVLYTAFCTALLMVQKTHDLRFIYIAYGYFLIAYQNFCKLQFAIELGPFDFFFV